MKIYYNYNTGSIMTEEEAREYAEEKIDEWGYEEMIRSIPAYQLWEMLSSEAQNKIIERLIESVYDEEFTFREIEEEEK